MPRTFATILCDGTQQRRFDDTLCFQGRDATGSFSLLAGHLDFMSVTDPGVTTLRLLSGTWFLASPPMLAHMDAGQLFLSTRRFFLSQHKAELVDLLNRWLLSSAEHRSATHSQVKQLEQALYNQLVQHSKHPNGSSPT